MERPATELNERIEFIENTPDEDFKKNVCIPYFKDIYKVSY
jgi:hypothetical protein